MFKHLEKWYKQRQKEKKIKKKNEQSVSDLCNNVKQSNTYVTEVPEGKQW